jgi:hypothetical protein
MRGIMDHYISSRRAGSQPAAMRSHMISFAFWLLEARDQQLAHTPGTLFIRLLFIHRGNGRASSVFSSLGHCTLSICFVDFRYENVGLWWFWVYVSLIGGLGFVIRSWVLEDGVGENCEIGGLGFVIRSWVLEDGVGENCEIVWVRVL